MAAFINLGAVVFGGANSNQVLVASGQNIQNAWDSHSPNLSNLGTVMGSGSLQWVGSAWFNNWMPVGQPITDPDLKNNGNGLLQGP
ncbi:hypothetical protein [Alicyclobacillus sp.]|uniref:hypothetical protein n=1 Tax=Alicyclobacillus sp. TaxID=61169 RepID=UPI0025BDFCB3|nr:hypothetical protein [Alicyclobacillus sp.]MCL6517681.1 hypothetical protein [Alicyclobacillus sp.]